MKTGYIPMWMSVLFVAIILSMAAPFFGMSQESSLNTDQLSQVEDLSESLANTLLDFSVAVRERDLKAVRSYFTDLVQTREPLFKLPTHPESIKWIKHGSVDQSTSQSKKRGVQEVVGDWAGLMNLFSVVEDSRFQVTNAKFRGEVRETIADGEIKFFIVGRDLSGKRFWVKGTGNIGAWQNERPGWKISRMIFDHLETLKSEVDLFSEVSLPAGVSISLPAYGTPGNDDFVYHGAAAADIDTNGFIDIIATGIDGNSVYLNQGDGKFERAGVELGLPPTPQATAPLLVDYDNDGDMDLFLSAVGDQMLFENRLVPDGKLVFMDVSLQAGVALPAMGFSAAAGDVNGDGWVDLYVTSYNQYGRIMPNSWHKATNGTANLLFINQKDGSFKESSRIWGVRDQRWSYAAQFADLNGDNRQDLYVVNDFGENAFYVNLGNRFEDRAEASGVLDAGNGMGVSVGDYDNDGYLDLYVTNMSSTAGNRIVSRLFPEARSEDNVLRKLAAGNSLFKGRPDGFFDNVTAEAGPFEAGWAWGGVFIDFDNDGWQDLYSPNGFISGKSMKDT